ncbi:hypothetical protein EVC45_07215 [Paraburkholderia sp. UYCP14C]|nr:hypothetical protein EVC45_07215 [Paraburkholderia sp. UYCP14C]
MLVLGIVVFCGLAFTCSIAVMVCLLNARQDSFATAIDARQTEPMVGAISRGALRTSIFTICLAAFRSTALHICLN